MTSPFKLKALSLAAALACCALAGNANAGPITTYTFSTSASSASNQQASATFSFGSGYLGLTLSNTGVVENIASVLDGLNFTASYDSGASLLSTAATDVVTCSDTSCTDSTTGIQSATYWSASFTGDSVAMVAGKGYHPYGIVNDSIDTEVNANGGRSGGLSNSEHNPYLEGPVTFNFLWPQSSESSIPSVSNVQFLFGTTPDYVDGTCVAGCTSSPPPVATPEPGALALFAAGLLGCALFVRRRRALARRLD
jgi:hypothetical protein